MEDIHDIKNIMDPDYVLIIVTLVCLSITIFLVFFIFFYKILPKIRDRFTRKNSSPSIKAINYKFESLKILGQIEQEMKHNPEIDNDKIYQKISEAVRLFTGSKIEKKGIAMTRKELTKFEVRNLDDILEVCYSVEFANLNVEQDFTQKIINLAKEYINKWN